MPGFLIDPVILENMTEKYNMSKAPEHSRPYNHEHAQLGAPITTKTGGKVTIFHIAKDRIIGMISGEWNEHAAEWSLDGESLGTDRDRGMDDLVMLPLGMCEGKPVFVGDKLEQRDRHNQSWVQLDAQIGHIDFSASRWLRAEPEYPKSRLNITERNKILTSAFPRGAMLNVVGGTHTVLEYGTALLADTAIARAIQDGDVVPAEMLEQVAQAICVSLKVTTTSSIDKAQIAAIIARVKAGE